jgi:hypothetical protein
MRGPICPRHKEAHYTGGAVGVNAGAGARELGIKYFMPMG